MKAASMEDGENVRARLCRSYLTAHLLDDYALRDILEGAAREMEPEREDRLALRLRLDRAIRDRIAGPGEREYAAIADDMEGLGWLEHAGTLRHLAGTDDLVREVREEWNARYRDRRPLAAELELDELAERGDLEVADADPVRGIDGAWYQRGYVTAAAYGGHVVIVAGRGASELAGFGDDEPGCERWAASRGLTAAGPLEPAPDGGTRTWLEEQLLAAMLTWPELLTRYRDQVPPDTFTADGRYEIYCALLALAGRGGQWYPGQVPGAVAGRQDSIPAEQAGVYGGDGLPWLRNYAERLAATTVEPADAAAAATAILVQDAGIRLHIEQEMPVTMAAKRMQAAVGQPESSLLRPPDPETQPRIGPRV
jgi:hypothetical protein